MIVAGEIQADEHKRGLNRFISAMSGWFPSGSSTGDFLQALRDD